MCIKDKVKIVKKIVVFTCSDADSCFMIMMMIKLSDVIAFINKTI